MPYSRIVKPSAGLFSSAEDLTHFLIAQLNQGQYQGNSILSEEGIATLHTPGIQFSENAGYAMGWSVFSFPDLASATPNNSVPTGLTHAGEWVGYTSLLVFIPELETGIVLVMNKHDPARMPEYFSVGWSLSLLAVGLDPFKPQSADFIGKEYPCFACSHYRFAWHWRGLGGAQTSSIAIEIWRQCSAESKT